MRIWQKFSSKIVSLSGQSWLPYWFVAIFSIVVFSPWFLTGKLPIPADTIVGLYHPWRDSYASTNPNGLPYKNFLITDSVRQQLPWRKMVVESWQKGEIPSWNPHTFSGVPLAANLQAASFYPLNIVYIFLPFEIAWSLQTFLQIVLGGIFMAVFLKSLKLHPLAVSLGSLAWIGSGFFVAWLESNNLVQVAIWMPLSLWSIEKMFHESKKWLYVLVFGLSLAMSFLAGALQIFFYTTGLVFSYFFFQTIRQNILKSVGRLVLGTTFAAILTFPQWNFLLTFFPQSVRSLSSTSYLDPGWFVPLNHLVQFLAPDFFGNPATQNYFGVWNYMEMIGYVGVVPLIFVLLAIVHLMKHSRFWVVLVAVCLVLMTDNPLARLLFQIGTPIWSLAQPTRLLVLVDFSLAVLAAQGLHAFIHGEIGKRKVSAASFLLLLVCFFLWIFSVSNHLSVSQQNLILPTAVSLLGAVLIFWAHKRQTNFLIVVLLAVTILDLTRFMTKFISFSPKEYLFPQTKLIKNLEQISSQQNVRLATIDDRIMPPNFSSVYHLSTLSSYDSFFLKRTYKLLTAIEMNNAKSDLPPNNRIVSLKNYTHPLFPLFGVTHVLTFGPVEDSKLSNVNHEGETYLYEYKPSLPRAFFVSQVINSSEKEAISKMFVSHFQPQNQAVVENYSSETNFASECRILKSDYKPNYLSFQTECLSPGFLVVLDSYYSSWKAFADGVQTEIYPTDFAFRGILVPQGTKKIELRYIN